MSYSPTSSPASRLSVVLVNTSSLVSPSTIPSTVNVSSGSSFPKILDLSSAVTVSSFGSMVSTAVPSTSIVGSVEYPPAYIGFSTVVLYSISYVPASLYEGGVTAQVSPSACKNVTLTPSSGTYASVCSCPL